MNVLSSIEGGGRGEGNDNKYNPHPCPVSVDNIDVKF